MDDLRKARRQKLEAEVRKAVLALFEHTGSGAFRLLLDPPHEILFVIAGNVKALHSMLPKEEEDAEQRKL